MMKHEKLNEGVRKINFYAIKSEESVCEELSFHLPVPTVHQKISFVLIVCCQSNCKNSFLIKWRSHYETHRVLYCIVVLTEHWVSDHSSHVRNRSDAFSYHNEKTDTRIKLNMIKKAINEIIWYRHWLHLPYRGGSDWRYLLVRYSWSPVHDPCSLPFLLVPPGGKNAHVYTSNIQICFKLNSLFTLML